MRQGVTRQYLKRKWPRDHRMHELIDYIHQLMPEIIMPDSIVSGGLVTWISELRFSVSFVIYWLQNVLHKVQGKEIILDPADSTYPRRDVIAVNDQWEIIVLKGTPAPDPQKPTVDRLTQIELTDVLIMANATEPEGVTTDLIYDENVEWTPAVSGVTVNFDAVTDPFSGSKCADVGAIGNGDTITFTASQPMAVADYETISGFLKLKEATTKQHALLVEFQLAGVPVSNAVQLLSTSVSPDWQSLALKLSDFSFSATQFDAVCLKWLKSGQQVDHAGFYLDLVKLEKGINQPEAGVDGKDGATWYSGTYHDPLVIGAKPGDFFLDTGTILGDVYKCTAIPETWELQMNIAPRIHPYTKNWLVNNQDTGIKAEGKDGVTPHIGANGNWWINTTDTGIKAEGTDGTTPVIGVNGNWWIDGVDTGILADASKLIVTSKKLLGRYSSTNGIRQEISVGDGLILGDDGVLSSESAVDSYIVVNENELLTAWNKAIISSRNTTIYIVGTITLTANRSFIAGANDPSILFEGVPNQNINVGAFRMEIGRVYFKNIRFRTSSSVYLWLTNGYAEFTNCGFIDEVYYNSDISQMKTHIVLFGNIDSGTGRISFDKVTHYSQTVAVNQGDIQPIIIRNSNCAFGGGNMYIEITNMPEVADFDRFARVLLLADVPTPYKVSGDLSWYYHPSQNLTLSVNMLKRGSIDDLRADYIPEDEVDYLLGITADKKIRKSSGIANDSVTYSKLHTSLKGSLAMSSADIDWSLSGIFTKTIIESTSFTFSNLQLNKVITIILTGDFVISWPSYMDSNHLIAGEYDGTKINYIQVHCTNAQSGNEEVWWMIKTFGI